jgi:hypothetical protein
MMSLRRLTYQANRRAAPMLAKLKAHAGPSGRRAAPPARRPG